MGTADGLGERVVLLAPLGRDAAVVSKVLQAVEIATTTVHEFAELLGAIAAGAGAALVTEEALTAESVAELAAAQAAQPKWSDLPVVLLLANCSPLIPATAQGIAALRATGNVTVLERPVGALTLVTAVQTALRARRRQYEVRDLIVQERAAREEAEAATRSKDEFFATVSHELRTPMNTILLWGQMLSRGRVKSQDLPKALRAIETSASVQSRLIEDLLDITRILSGKLRVQLREEQLVPAAHAALEAVRPMAEAKGIQLDVQLDPATGPVLADPERIQQVIWNLLSNAVKFTPQGGRVSLGLMRLGGHAQIQVVDTGVGMAAEFMPHVFDRFRQAETAATPSQKGLGLGLAIVRQLVELHGGTVTADSAGEGKGAVFTVRLPLLDRDRASEAK